ncbi:glycosyltransferase family 4 protein [Kiritimatiellota bacterium B12222]|nr:glycosyltransferase family 4 protein [Kiritimatiellota bacterium B12222]
MPVDWRVPLRGLLRSRTQNWPDYQRLFLIEDRSSWVIHWEMMQLADAASRSGIKTAHPFWMPHSKNQAVFYGSQFFLLAQDWITRPHRIATAYFHGKPGTGPEEFDLLYQQVVKHHEKISRLQVSHSEMEQVLLETGIAPEKVHRIPIGIQCDLFPRQTPASKQASRISLGIAEDAFVVGSFQKDGEGWGDGDEPKLIKGPDVFVQSLERIRDVVPNLHVLLSGPARGYVKKELGKLGIPFTHHSVKHYPDIHRLYAALDCYLVASRQEGGPKAVLESMSSGIPLVTTRVGQAMDMVLDGVNGFMCEVEDVDGLAERVLQVFRKSEECNPMLSEARKVAEANDYQQLDPLWQTFFDGFVEASV